MYDNKNTELADLLLMFIYIEVIGLVSLTGKQDLLELLIP